MPTRLVKKEAKVKKGQAANETAIVIGIMLLFMIAFFAVVSDKFVVAADARSKALADDVADVIKSELDLAASAQDGYSRIFSLPASLDGNGYGLLLYNKSNTGANFTQFVVNMSVSGVDYSTVRIVPDNIVGVLSAGENFVRKQAGIVNVTPPLS